MSMKDELDAVLAAQPNEGAVEWGISCASFMSRNGARLRAAVEDAEKWRALQQAIENHLDEAATEAEGEAFTHGYFTGAEDAAARASENKTP